MYFTKKMMGPPIPGAPWNHGRSDSGGFVIPEAPDSPLAAQDPFLRRGDPSMQDIRLRGFTERLTALVNSLFGQGYLEQTGVNSWVIRNANVWVVDREPTPFDDDLRGFSPGMVWIDTTGQNVYFAISVSTGAAIWRSAGATGATGPSGAIGATGSTGATGAAGSWTKLATSTASASASIVFTGLSSAYVAYRVVWAHVAPGTDGDDLWFRTSADNGSTYDSGAANYRTQRTVSFNPTPNVAGVTPGADTKMIVSATHGNASNELSSGELTIFNPSAAQYGTVSWKEVYSTTDGTLVANDGGGQRVSAAAVNAIQFLFSSGSIASGKFDLFGLAN